MDHPTIAALWIMGIMLAATLAQPGEVSAKDPCANVDNCQPQVQAPVKVGPCALTGWAYYSTGDHPFYWYDSGGHFSKDNGCVAITDNLLEEDGDHPSKMDAIISNHCLKDETFTLTLGCSAQPEFQSCQADPGIFPDPVCPVQGKVKQYCHGTVILVCILVWEEVCANGDQYWCNSSSIQPTTCTRCAVTP